MTGASIETTLELWVSSLRDVKARMRGLFTQERVAASANQILDGLLGDERRKTDWMRAARRPDIRARGAAGPSGSRKMGCRPASRHRTRLCRGASRDTRCGPGHR